MLPSGGVEQRVRATNRQVLYIEDLTNLDLSCSTLTARQASYVIDLLTKRGKEGREKARAILHATKARESMELCREWTMYG